MGAPKKWGEGITSARGGEEKYLGLSKGSIRKKKLFWTERHIPPSSRNIVNRGQTCLLGSRETGFKSEKKGLRRKLGRLGAARGARYTGQRSRG